MAEKIDGGQPSPEEQDPVWVAKRREELAALEVYNNIEPGAPGRSAAREEAQRTWLERSSYEAENFDPKP
ncbi:MAG TPA: hypothetical protein VF733_06930 [Candidatus Saccharimonadales bacterium]